MQCAVYLYLAAMTFPITVIMLQESGINSLNHALFFRLLSFSFSLLMTVRNISKIYNVTLSQSISIEICKN